MTRGAKNSKEGFSWYIARRRKAKESMPLVINEKGGPVTTDMEKAEVPATFFPQPSLPVRLTTSFKSLNLQAGAGGAKCLPL